ncbi:hypothetical protein ACC702_37810, partial [Rhizobium ruizarguesonis]
MLGLFNSETGVLTGGGAGFSRTPTYKKGYASIFVGPVLSTDGLILTSRLTVGGQIPYNGTNVRVPAYSGVASVTMISDGYGNLPYASGSGIPASTWNPGFYINRQFAYTAPAIKQKDMDALPDYAGFDTPKEQMRPEDWGGFRAAAALAASQ